MGKIAIISCDHGFGHIKRCYLYSLELVKRGHFVELFGPQDGLSKFSDLYGGQAKLNLHFLNTSSRPDNSMSQWLNWLTSMPDLKSFDYVVSDNLPELLTLRNDTILSGSFFWHTDIPNIDRDYKHFCEDLIFKYRPKHIAAEFFVSDELKASSEFLPIGLIGNVSTPPKNSLKYGALLISGGKNNIINQHLRQWVSALSKKSSPKTFTKIYADEALLPKKCPPWITRAVFDEDMYSSLSLALIRPGVGTVTDCLRHGVFILSISEPDNHEMKRNLRVLKDYHLGDEAGFADDVSDVFERIDRSYCDFLTKRTPPKFNGAQGFADYFEGK